VIGIVLSGGAGLRVWAQETTTTTTATSSTTTTSSSTTSTTTSSSTTTTATSRTTTTRASTTTSSSSTSTTRRPTTTTSTTTTSTVRPTTTTTVACAGDVALCDDQNACTEDACDPSAGCRHTELPQAEVSGILCGVENMRAALGGAGEPLCPRRCPRSLEAQLERIVREIGRALGAATRGRCLRRVRAGARVARALDRRVARLLATGRLTPLERGLRLSTEATRVRIRTAAFGAGLCGPRR
jgi:hypothetical protein